MAIKLNYDAFALQTDLDKLSSRGNYEENGIHTDKCNVISSVARNLKKKPITFKYPLNNHSLEHVTTSKTSGVNHQLKP